MYFGNYADTDLGLECITSFSQQGLCVLSELHVASANSYTTIYPNGFVRTARISYLPPQSVPLKDEGVTGSDHPRSKVQEAKRPLFGMEAYKIFAAFKAQPNHAIQSQILNGLKAQSSYEWPRSAKPWKLEMRFCHLYNPAIFFSSFGHLGSHVDIFGSISKSLFVGSKSSAT